MGSPLHQNSIRIELIHDHNIAVVIMIFGCLWSAIPDFTQAHTKGEGHRCYYEGYSIHRNGGTCILLIIGATNTREWTSEQAWTRPDLVVALILTCSAFTSGLFSLVARQQDKCKIAGRNW
jgi:hypothetical protein